MIFGFLGKFWIDIAKNIFRKNIFSRYKNLNEKSKNMFREKNMIFSWNVNGNRKFHNFKKNRNIFKIFNFYWLFQRKFRKLFDLDFVCGFFVNFFDLEMFYFSWIFLFLDPRGSRGVPELRWHLRSREYPTSLRAAHCEHGGGQQAWISEQAKNLKIPAKNPWKIHDLYKS